MLAHGHDRFPDDVGQISPDRIIPIQSDNTQRWTGYKASADAKEPPENPDDKPDYAEIDRADMRAGDWKKHILFLAAANQPQQKRSHILKNDGLADHEQYGNAGVGVTVVTFQLMQSRSQKMQDQEKIYDDQDRVDHELD